MSFLTPKAPQKPPPPPSTPTRADSSVREAGQRQLGASVGYDSLISTSSTGLARKAETKKRSLIGGA